MAVTSLTKEPVFLTISSYDTASNFGSLVEIATKKDTNVKYWKAITDPIPTGAGNS